MKGRAQIITRTVKSCWYCLKWLLAIVVAVLAVGVPYVWFGIDDAIRSRVEARLNEHYGPLGLDVRVASARLIDGNGIQILGLSVVNPSATGPQAKLIDIEELYLSCQISPEELIHGRLPITNIKMTRPTLHATRHVDGSWNVAGLWPLPKFDDTPNRPPASVQIVDATIDLLDSFKQPARGLMLRNINLTIGPRGPSVRSPGETSTPVATGHSLMFKGEWVGDSMRSARLEGEFDPASGKLKLSGNVKDLEISPDLRDSLPIQWKGEVASWAGFHAQANVSFEVEHDPSRTQPLSYHVVADLTKGRIRDPRLPYPLTDLAARIDCTEAGYRVDKMTGHWGPAKLTLSCQGKGFDGTRPMTLSGRIENLMLDQRMVRLLPVDQRGVWDKYQPGGRVDIDVHAVFDGQQWSPNLLVKCLDVSFTHYKFPYRMKRTTGTLHLQGKQLDIDLLSHVGERPMRVQGKVHRPGPDYTGWIEIEAKQVTLDKDILAAMPAKQKPVIDALQPRGTVDYWGRFERRDARLTKPNHHMLLTLHDCAIKYKKFAYPIEGIRGTMEIVDGRLTLRDVQNANIRCSGGWRPQVDRGRLDLHFIATDVPLEEPLRDALQPRARQLWSDLRPRGVIDLLEIDVAFLAKTKQLDVYVSASKRPEKSTADNRSIAINPVFFPYRIENIHGAATYHNGRVDMHGVKGQHGRTRFKTGGFCEKTDDGGFRLQFKDLLVEQLRIDRDLFDALSGKLKRLVTSLHFKGPLSLQGTLHLQRAGTRDAKTATRWDVTVNTQQGQMACGVKLRNIHGDVRLRGYDQPGKTTYCQGLLNLDAVTYQDFQFTEVNGPLELVDGQLLFGSRARRLGKRHTPAPISAKIVGGRITADAIVKLEEKEPMFWLQTQLTGGDLSQLAQEALSGRQKLSGRITATLQLEGTSAGTSTLRGTGKVILRDANIFELPFMVSMLKVLSVRLPDATAFTTGDVNFRVSGSYLYFDPINLKGDAISLLGNGWANLDRQIQLNFFAVVGRDRINIPIISPLLVEASRQILEIRMDGSLDDPKIKRETFRGAKTFLKHLERDLNLSTEPADVFNPAREVLHGMRNLVR